MFDHVTIRVSDREASERFYETVLAALGIEVTARGALGPEWDDFSLTPATAERPVTRRLHIGFSAPSRAHVDAFWQAGVDAGFRDDGAPGERDYTATYYGGFLLDPDGNSAEAVHYEEGLRTDGHVDHLWLRVRDVAASSGFYAAIAPHAGIRRTRDTPERATFDRVGDGGGTFSLLPGEPTEHLHMAFGAPDEATVHAFHAAALAAGGPDAGAPGERPQYHRGYYAAFALDPDGHVIESVDHHR